ncbi:hypothetical protein [Domibacillus indicus]|uniref:hypothetical protein n=1 Tax=Domibacillus indicus TaxID=1437523 RepID=UPI000617DF32|nr:hypothetical protein [Domibacillus indicus]
MHIKIKCSIQNSKDNYTGEIYLNGVSLLEYIAVDFSGIVYNSEKFYNYVSFLQYFEQKVLPLHLHRFVNKVFDLKYSQNDLQVLQPIIDSLEHLIPIEKKNYSNIEQKKQDTDSLFFIHLSGVELSTNDAKEKCLYNISYELTLDIMERLKLVSRDSNALYRLAERGKLFLVSLKQKEKLEGLHKKDIMAQNKITARSLPSIKPMYCIKCKKDLGIYYETRVDIDEKGFSSLPYHVAVNAPRKYYICFSCKKKQI